MAASRRRDSIDVVFALPAVFTALPGLHRCGCCGGVFSRGRMTELGSTRGTFICRDCARSAAERRPQGRR